jgi:di/tricarboxylate transporter
MSTVCSQTLSKCLGRWPVKSVKFITGLLKNAEANADAKNLELEELFVKNIVVQQAPVRIFIVLIVPLFLTFCRKPAEEPTVPMVGLTLTKVIHAT